MPETYAKHEHNIGPNIEIITNICNTNNVESDNIIKSKPTALDNNIDSI